MSMSVYFSNRHKGGMNKKKGLHHNGECKQE